MGERLTWKDIKKQYPDQWVGLADIEWEPENRSMIKTAVVKYSEKSEDDAARKSKNDLTTIQIRTNGALVAIYTTPDRICIG